MAEKGQNVVDALKAKGDELAAVRNADRKERADEAKIALDAALTNERNSEAMFSVRDALRIMYSLMLIDGIVSPEEGKKFDEMGLAYDQDFDIFKKQLIDESYTAAQTESALGVEFVSIESEDSGEYYDQIHDYVENLIREENFYRTEGIQAKELINNLLVIAHSEGEYSADEKRLIRFIAGKTGVDDEVLTEMEQKVSGQKVIETAEY
jgi:tellurite resistance protein